MGRREALAALGANAPSLPQVSTFLRPYSMVMMKRPTQLPKDHVFATWSSDGPFLGLP